MADGPLGGGVLPEEVQNRRRKLREKVSNAREPIKQRRQDIVPGPDVIGTAEQNLMNLRDRFSGMDSVLSRVKNLRGGSSGGGGSPSGSSSSSNNSSSSTPDT